MKTEIADFLLTKYGKKNAPAVKAGDTVRVHQKIKEGDKERVQIFEGLVIAVKHGAGLNGTFTVRKIAAGGIGVERTYPLHSPNILKVERIKNAEVSRAKLYYMRTRLGKAARFKNENRDYMSWAESAVSAEAPADLVEEEMQEDILPEDQAAEEVTPEEVAEVQEITPEEAVETVAAAEEAEVPTEEIAEETQEVKEEEQVVEAEEVAKAEEVKEDEPKEEEAKEETA